MMWISLPKRTLPCTSGATSSRLPSDGMRQETRLGDDSQHTDEHSQTPTRARAGARAQPHPLQDNTSHNYYHPSGFNTRCSRNYSGGRGPSKGQTATPQGVADQYSTRKRPERRTPEGGHDQLRITTHMRMCSHPSGLNRRYHRNHRGGHGLSRGRAAAPLGAADQDKTRKRPEARTSEGGHNLLHMLLCKMHSYVHVIEPTLQKINYRSEYRSILYAKAAQSWYVKITHRLTPPPRLWKNKEREITRKHRRRLIEIRRDTHNVDHTPTCLLYTSPSPRD